MQIQEIYPGSVLVTYVQSPSNPLEIFLILILIHPKINTLYTTWQNTLCQICTTFLNTKKTTTLWMITMNSITLKTCTWLWTRYLIGELLEFFTKELELCKEMKVKTSFLQNRIFNRALDRKLIFFNWCIHPRTTSLFIVKSMIS